MSNLLVIKGATVGVKYPLDEKTTIGRAQDNTIQVFDANISRNHCEILRQGRAFQIRDLSSRNGVLINGKRVKKKILLRNDELVIGATTFLFNTDKDLKNTRFSNKRVYFTSPTDETIVHLDSALAREREDTPNHKQRVEADRKLVRGLAEVFTSSRLPLPEALERILQTLLGIFSAARGCLMEWDPVTKDFAPLVVLSDGDAYTISQKVISCIIEEKRAVLIPAKNHHAASTAAASLSVPLLKEEEIVGLLCLEIADGDQILLHDIQLLQSVATLTQLAIEHSRALEQLEVERVRSRPRGRALIGTSQAFTRVLGLLDRVADTSSTVLLTGETGTGKEMVAREIHRLSGRDKYPFIAINCAAIPENLIEGELFGHERGAFTGADRMRRGLIETAHGGTLLLDEIGEMAPLAQTKLLRFLQDRVITRVGGHQPIPVDVRVIAATNIDLAEAVRARNFREDLWYRLNVFGVALPPLRERRDDIPLLADSFLRRYAREYNKPVQGISSASLRMLEAHNWLGNVRELQNAIERAILMCDGPSLQPEHFSVAWGTHPLATRTPNPHQDPQTVRIPFNNAVDTSLTLADAEKYCILRALESCDWNRVQAAQQLKIHRNTLHKKIALYNLEPA